MKRCKKNLLFHPLQLHQVLVQLQTGEKEQDFSLLPIQVSISVQLWRLPGCHEFLAALGESAGGEESCPFPTSTQASSCLSGLERSILNTVIYSLYSFLTVCTGFDLCEVGQEEVVLKTGKLANRRTLHFALQSLLALFGKLILDISVA